MENSTLVGKQGEYKVIGKLMSEGLTIYTPVADIEGIDCIIRNEYCRLIELQIKTRNKNEEENRQFRVRDLKPNKNFFVACYFIDTNELWVIPSFKFAEICIKNEEGVSILSMSVQNQLKLATYKDGLGIGLLKMREFRDN